MPKQEPEISLNPSLSQPERKISSNIKRVKNRIHLNFKIKKQLVEPETKKKIHGAALIGFILGLAAVVIIFAGSFLAFAFGLAGAILGIIGLSTIKKNPEKFRGRGFAWVGIAVGILKPLFIIGYLLAFAGAFSS